MLTEIQPRAHSTRPRRNSELAVGNSGSEEGPAPESCPEWPGSALLSRPGAERAFPKGQVHPWAGELSSHLRGHRPRASPSELRGSKKQHKWRMARWAACCIPGGTLDAVLRGRQSGAQDCGQRHIRVPGSWRSASAGRGADLRESGDREGWLWAGFPGLSGGSRGLEEGGPVPALTSPPPLPPTP